MKKDGDSLSVTPETVARLAAAEAAADGGNGMGNLLSAIDSNVAGEIAGLEVERDGLVVRVLALNAQIVRLQTHAQVGGLLP